MKTKSLRPILVAMALCGAVVASTASPAFAAGPTPPGDPEPTGIASLTNFGIWSKVSKGCQGLNLISIPGISPINNNPTTSGPLNGFRILCATYGLTIATSVVQQFNGELGQITSYNCNQPIAPEWTPGQGAMILFQTDPNNPVLEQRPGIIAGDEATRLYSTYVDGVGAEGDQIYPIPVTIAAQNLLNVCDQLGLQKGPQFGHCIHYSCDVGNTDTCLTGPSTGSNCVSDFDCGECTQGMLGNHCSYNADCDPGGDAVKYIDAETGACNDYICGQTAPPALVIGRGLFIQPDPQGICDLTEGGTHLCVHGKVGTPCSAHSDCTGSPAFGPTPGDVASTGKAIMQ